MVLFGIRHWALDISFKINKGGCLNIPTIDLKIFAPKYRQALLYAMIEGLNEGSAFSFSDDRNPGEIESELSSAGLNGYRWVRASNASKGDAAYLIERKSQASLGKESCCGCCGAQSKE